MKSQTMNIIRKIPATAALMLLCAVLFTFHASAQNGGAPGNPTGQRQAIESQRIAFITQQLHLTTQEAQVFWPVYNKYHDELDAIRKNRMTDLLSAKANFDTYNDAQVNKLIDDEFDSRQKELDVQRKYNTEFEKVLPVKKVALLYRAEQQFKVNLIREMQMKKGGQQPGPGHPQH